MKIVFKKFFKLMQRDFFKSLIILVALNQFSFAITIESQRPKSDSLFAKLNLNIDDTSRVNLLNQIAYNYVPLLNNLAIKFADSAFVLAQQISWEKGAGVALNNLGDALRYSGKPFEALKKYQLALSIFQKLDNKEIEASTNHNIGIAYTLLSDYSNALKHYELALEYYTKTNNINQISKIQSSLGILYSSYNKIDEAIKYFELSFNHFFQLKDTANFATQLGNIGLIFEKEEKYSKALNYYLKSMVYFVKIGDYYKYSIFLGNAGVVYLKTENYDKAELYFSRALKYSKKIEDEYGVAYQLANFGEMYFKKGLDKNVSKSKKEKSENLRKAESFLIEACSKFEQMKFMEEFQNYKMMLSNVYENQLNFERALSAFRIAKSVQDSIHSIEKSEAISRLEIKQYLDLSKKEIKILNQKREFDNYLKISLIIFAFLLLSSLAMALYFYSRKKKDNLILRENIDRRIIIEKELNESKTELENHKISLERIVDERTEKLSQEILEHKKTESALFEMNEIFRLFIKHNPVYVFIKDKNIRTLFLSDNYSKLLNRPIDELLGKNMFELFPSELSEKMDEQDRNILIEGKPIEVIEEFKQRIYFTIKFPIYIKGEAKFVAGYTTDITDKKKAEEELIKSKERAENASKAKSVFLANMSHELRTPLVGILGYSGMLTKELIDPEHKEMAEGINRTGKRLLNTLSMVLDLSRIESDRFEMNFTVINVKDIISEVYQNFKGLAELKKLKLNLVMTEKPITVNTDIVMLKTILENLTNNAIKFTLEGQIDIEINVKEDSEEKFVIIKVSDSGIGIKADKISLVFEEFKQLSEGTTKEFPGTGLGLSITKKYVDLLKGNISVESTFGVGTTFLIELPIDPLR